MTRLDPGIADGMRAQLAARRDRLAAGERPLGWKVGFGSPDSLARLGTDRPLVGFLTDATLIADGTVVSLAGWAAPVLEAEIAVRVGTGTIAAAIELADLDPPPVDVREILAGNIFHRRVLLGTFAEHDASDVTARIFRNGEQIAATEDPAAATGEVRDVLRSTAETLAVCGESLRDGDIVITGSVVPAIPLSAGERYRVELPPLGALEVTLV
jgi:2-keto-4-pentenoate hydratase